MARTKKAPKKVQKKSFILTLGLVLLIGYFAITIIGNFFEYNDLASVKEQKDAELEQMQAENDYLESIILAEDKSDYIEQVAREKLGFVMPGEKVFYDVTPGA